jgi:uncharacterized RDD family membrane protein YckC
MVAVDPPLAEPVTNSLRRPDPAVGAVTRSIAWIADAVVLNLVAVLVGVGIALITSIVPIWHGHRTLAQAVAGTVYVVWCAAYFVVFWATTGQTPGARLMQIRLTGPDGERVRVPRACLRWLGMQLAILPLFAGYAPLIFGRRPLPDWMAHTLVKDTPQLSLAGKAMLHQ